LSDQWFNPFKRDKPKRKPQTDPSTPEDPPAEPGPYRPDPAHTPIRKRERAEGSSSIATNPTIDDLKAPLLASLGAADLALATVTDLLAELRERAEETRTDTRSRVEESRARLTKLQEDLPEQLRELRERFTTEELRTAAEGYVEAATSRYNELVERGEAALERLRSQSGFDEASARGEGYVDQAVELTQEALGTVASQTRAVGERAAKLVGIELPKKTDAAAKKPQKAVAKKAPAKKAPAKKAPAKKVTQK
jgi:heparin binding hemagglutinin HbhA